MTPYEQGYEAFQRGEGRHMNPYDLYDGPESLQEWDDGWSDAELEYEELMAADR